MRYYIPTKVFEERNCVLNHKKELAELGKRALIITGKSSSKKNGALSDLAEALKAEHISYALYDRVEENPSVETVLRAARLGLAEKIDFVIGVGGGSPMDAAKAVAFLVKHEKADETLLYTDPNDNDMLPVVEIPTTCGTGSEVTAVSILTRDDTNKKGSIPHKLFPVLALVDWKYLRYAPAAVIYDTAMDAFAHLCESYINTASTDYSEAFVVQGLSIWSRAKETLSEKRQLKEADYRNLMNASTLAGMAIAHTATVIPHALSYTVTCKLGMSHGSAVGRFLPGYIACADIKKQKLLLNMAGFETLRELEDFYVKLCGQEKISEDILDAAVADVMSKPEKLALCPYILNETKLKKIAGWM